MDACVGFPLGLSQFSSSCLRNLLSRLFYFLFEDWKKKTLKMYNRPKRSFLVPSHQTVLPAQKLFFFFFTWFLEGSSLSLPQIQSNGEEQKGHSGFLVNWASNGLILSSRTFGLVFGQKRSNLWLVISLFFIFLFFIFFYWSNLCCSSLVSL